MRILDEVYCYKIHVSAEEVLNAEEEILKTERGIYEQVCKALCEHGSQLLRTARTIARR